MKDLFKNRNGWIAFLIVAAGIAGVGFSKLLSKNLNLSLLILLLVAIIAVYFFNRGKDEK